MTYVVIDRWCHNNAHLGTEMIYKSCDSNIKSINTRGDQQLGLEISKLRPNCALNWFILHSNVRTKVPTCGFQEGKFKFSILYYAVEIKWFCGEGDQRSLKLCKQSGAQ